jgi:hypothetical protein
MGRKPMHARVTKFGSSPDKVEEGLKRVREVVIPAVKKLQGFKGGYWLVDRGTGKGFGLTLFENESALKATEEAAAQIRSQASTATKISGVERYEVVAEVPASATVAAGRLTRFEGSAEEAKKLIDHTNEKVIPRAKEIAGFKGGYWLMDRQTGKGFAITLFESDAALRASEDSAAQIRSQATQEAGAKMTGVERYEVFAQALPEPAMAAR